MEGEGRRRYGGSFRLGSACGSHDEEKKSSSGYHVIMRKRKKQNVAWYIEWKDTERESLIVCLDEAIQEGDSFIWRIWNSL